MKNNSTFVSDQFECWQKCQKLYYYKYVKELNWPDTEQDYRLGISVHALINYYLKGFNVDNLLIHADNDVIDCWNNIKSNSLFDNKVLLTEWSFNSRIKNSNYWLNGRIDAVFYNEKEKKYIIADWKTGELPKHPEKKFQHKIYLYSFFNAQKRSETTF